ncbi:hypothetical protein BXT84_05480 [Sulfobacillus thermotolerans]|uniref:Uncharacterized protein n=1 Tax=Sulfobacillus thermotolerans TaxID=338644 RepID=A0ABM6RQ33_9FIRM|nr:hypothetical protein BXT84_05480 [Sulfobacillus thermotolerans]
MLDRYGIIAQSVAQEHSSVPTLYRRKGDHPVVVLDAAVETVRRRRRMAWTRQHYWRQWYRLISARQAARLIVRTDPLTPEEVAAVIVQWFDRWTGLDVFWSQNDSSYTVREQKQIRLDVCYGRGVPALKAPKP